MEKRGTYKHKKVMVVDDNEIDRYVAQIVMETSAFAEHVICMETAMEALEYLKAAEHTPDELPHLIFLDINMPEMSGFDFLDEYSKLSDSIKKNCIIMMLTTSLNDEDRLNAESNEYVFRFLNKPLDNDKISELHVD